MTDCLVSAGLYTIVYTLWRGGAAQTRGWSWLEQARVYLQRIAT